MNDRVRPAGTPDAAVVAALGGLRNGQPGWFRRNRLWLGIGAAVLVAGALALLFSGGDSGQAFETGTAERRDLSITVTATGSLKPMEQVDVGAEISGRIARIAVDFNARVKQGDVLAELDTEQLVARSATSKAQVEQARAQLATARATLTEAEATFQRVAEIQNSPAISPQRFDTAKAARDRAVAGVALATAQLASAESQARVDEANLAKAVIRAPIDGLVLDRKVEVGQTVVASLQTPVLFTIASDLTKMKLEVAVDEADIGAVKPGQSATFTVDAYPNRVFAAVITEVRAAPRVAQGVVTYDTVLAVDNPEGLIFPGMTATAEITTEVKRDVLTVPNAALRYTPPGVTGDEARPRRAQPGEGAIGRVWKQGEGRPEPLDLKIGATDRQYTEVLDGGIEAGASVITGAKRRNR